MKHIFIINPTSGNGDYHQVVEWIEKNFKDSPDAYEIHYTEGIGHAIKIASQYREGVVVYSVGGDGTAHEILNGMNLSVPLSVIPVGTGNDFFKMIHFKKNLESLLDETVNRGKTIMVDIGEVNGRRFLNCSNMGIDAEINQYANGIRPKYISRNFVYIYSALRKVLRMKPTSLKIEIDGEVIEKDITLFSIMNGKWYGNGFKSTPNAKFNDGLFDVCIVDALKIPRAMTLIPKYLKGTHLNEKEVEIKQLKQFKVTSEKPIYYGCDGEIFNGTSLEYKICEGVLQLRIPETATLV